MRTYVIDALNREQIHQLSAITEALLERLDPTGALTSPYQRPTSAAGD